MSRIKIRGAPLLQDKDYIFYVWGVQIESRVCLPSQSHKLSLNIFIIQPNLVRGAKLTNFSTAI